MATFLRSVALDDDLHVTPSGRLAILRDDRPGHAGRWYLTATGSGQRVDAAGDFDTAEDAARFAAHLDKTAVNGQLTKFQQPFDFSDPQLDRAARDWRSTKGENIQDAILRARKEFDATPAPAAAPKNTADAPANGGTPKRVSSDSARCRPFEPTGETAATSRYGPRATRACSGPRSLSMN